MGKRLQAMGSKTVTSVIPNRRLEFILRTCIGMCERAKRPNLNGD